MTTGNAEAPLLSLPAEIRFRVFDYLFNDLQYCYDRFHDDDLLSAKNANYKAVVNILFVNHSLRSEALPQFAKSLTVREGFAVSLEDCPCLPRESATVLAAVNSIDYSPETYQRLAPRLKTLEYWPIDLVDRADKYSQTPNAWKEVLEGTFDWELTQLAHDHLALESKPNNLPFSTRINVVLNRLRPFCPRAYRCEIDAKTKQVVGRYVNLAQDPHGPEWSLFPDDCWVPLHETRILFERTNHPVIYHIATSRYRIMRVESELVEKAEAQMNDERTWAEAWKDFPGLTPEMPKARSGH